MSEQIHAKILVDATVFPCEVVLKAAHTFTHQFYIEICSSDSNQTKVSLRPKEAEADMDAARGLFQNELIEQRLRLLIGQQTAGIRDLIMSHALSKSHILRPDLETSEPGS